ncbi:uncharacterized protein K452DRAFT_291152 [Aplosporella prunicola CBS 121167]|uniref:Uncharacterized protein n=1 Tax=Aplosporella prunicola CBS 121167 TaxID=1176127 RepID=A0A6A6B4B7_9PEZI|nr:uncharacterized protein K452DRAFT_291152 [Aplosporella prunicola CBS 121167]KAF2138105.1 hypothetical protein K452DRAFT_291152 [Aplosporella prunicola CBS 121167]
MPTAPHTSTQFPSSRNACACIHACSKRPCTPPPPTVSPTLPTPAAVHTTRRPKPKTLRNVSQRANSQEQQDKKQ